MAFGLSQNVDLNRPLQSFGKPYKKRMSIIICALKIETLIKIALIFHYVFKNSPNLTHFCLSNLPLSEFPSLSPSGMCREETSPNRERNILGNTIHEKH